MTDAAVILPALGSGALVGFALSVVGGGGSILAVPLLVYGVGVPSPHIAIGTSAAAVAINALVNLARQARAGAVKWRCAGVFSASGLAGALAGSALGRQIDGQKLLAAFAVLMIAVGLLMLKHRHAEGRAEVRLSRSNLPWLLGLGFGAGLLSGFFGIGGGFLIVPALMAATGMPIRYAVGSSLMAVATFGVATSTTYAMAGLIDWTLVSLFVAGGLAGLALGGPAARILASRRGLLNSAFASAIFLVAGYILVRSLGAT